VATRSISGQRILNITGGVLKRRRGGRSTTRILIKMVHETTLQRGNKREGRKGVKLLQGVVLAGSMKVRRKKEGKTRLFVKETWTIKRRSIGRRRKSIDCTLTQSPVRTRLSDND